MLPFEAPLLDSDNWDGCMVKAEQDCDNPKPSSWTESKFIQLTDEFKKRVALHWTICLSECGLGRDEWYASYMTENQATGEDAAIEFWLQGRRLDQVGSS